MEKVFASLSDKFISLSAGIDRQDDFADQFQRRNLGKPYYSPEDLSDRSERVGQKVRIGQILFLAQRRWMKANRKPADICPPVLPYGHSLRLDFGAPQWGKGFLARIGEIRDNKSA